MKEDNKILVIPLSVLTVTIITLGIVMFAMNDNKHNRNVEIYIESNDIGCSRWRYNNSYYWKCPNTDVNSVVKHGAKGVSKQEPVITYEGEQ